MQLYAPLYFLFLNPPNIIIKNYSVLTALIVFLGLPTFISFAHISLDSIILN